MGQRTIQVFLYQLMVSSSHGRDVTAFPISPMLFTVWISFLTSFCSSDTSRYLLLPTWHSFALVALACGRLHKPHGVNIGLEHPARKFNPFTFDLLNFISRFPIALGFTLPTPRLHLDRSKPLLDTRNCCYFDCITAPTTS